MEIRDEARKLAPWHLGVEVPGGSSRDFYEPQDGPFYDPSRPFGRLLRRIYPDGLQGRSALDLACNNGAYLFAAKDNGAGRCLGNDVRELWIRQARFLADLRGDEMEFQVGDLYDLDAGQFDLVIFAGIFYHLPNPIKGLQLAARHCRGVIFVASMALRDRPDGALVVGTEDVAPPLSGVDGLQWYPTGPGAIEAILASEGLVTRRHGWFTPKGVNPAHDAVQVIGARDGLLKDYDASQPRAALRPRHPG